MKQSVALVLAVVVMAGSFGCGGPEERKAKYRLRAQEYFQQGNYPKARVALRNVLKIDPKDAEAYFLYAQVEEKESNWRNAVADYQQVVELNPDHDRAWIKLGKYYLEARALDMVGLPHFCPSFGCRFHARCRTSFGRNAPPLPHRVVDVTMGRCLSRMERFLSNF